MLLQDYITFATTDALYLAALRPMPCTWQPICETSRCSYRLWHKRLSTSDCPAGGAGSRGVRRRAPLNPKVGPLSIRARGRHVNVGGGLG